MSKSLSSLTYRPDIDGLRAIAVCAVVIFHAFPHLLPGGYLGVDIFFVISGYLIALLLEQQLSAPRLNIVHFFQARCWRLVPALCAVLIINLLVASFIYSVVEQQELIKQTRGAVLFFSNFYLETKEGLFSDLSSENPLLHLWSLGVEMQFYLFFACIAWLIHKKKGAFTAVCIALGWVSFLYADWLMGIDEKKAFYSPVARLWEMMAGAVAALAFQNGKNRYIPLKAPSFLLIGLGAAVTLVYCLFFFQSASSDIWKKGIPVGATALLLITAPHTFLIRCLSTTPMIWLGRISYSLYLWHWPFIAYVTAIQSDYYAEPKPAMLVIAVCGSVVVAWWSYRYLETPIRAKRQWKLTLLLWLAVWVSAFSLGFMVDE